MKGDDLILGADDPKRDKTIVKTCNTCGRKFHPRKNGYQLVAKYCGAACARSGRRSL